MAGITATYVSPSGFTVETNRTDEFIADRRVKADCGVDGFKFGTITSSSYSNPNTTVNLTVASEDLTSNLTDVYYGLVSEGSSGSVPIHSHNGDEGSGGAVTGADHTIASHSDTTATGAELEQLTDGSDTTLHDHDGISENSAARHTQGTDTTLGTMTADIDMDSTYQVVGLQAPTAAGEALRQTINITEADLEQLTDGSDTTLHDHDGISENSAARHTQNTDTALGAQSENLDMNTHKIVGVVDPTENQEAATKKYVDDNAGSGNASGYLHTQAATATSWTVTHNLSFLYPNVELISGGKSLSGTYSEPEITYDTTNQLTCTFTVGTSGYCYCVGGS